MKTTPYTYRMIDPANRRDRTFYQTIDAYSREAADGEAWKNAEQLGMQTEFLRIGQPTPEDIEEKMITTDTLTREMADAAIDLRDNWNTMSMVHKLSLIALVQDLTEDVFLAAKKEQDQ